MTVEHALAIERVLMAVDDSAESRAAARTGARLAAGWGARVRLITVVADSVVRAAVAAVAEPEAEQRRLAGAEILLRHVRQEVIAAGVPEHSVDVGIRTGVAYRGILTEARTFGADLIVMAVSSATGLRSPYVGSETEHVLEFSRCPVLVVPFPGAHSHEAAPGRGRSSSGAEGASSKESAASTP